MKIVLLWLVIALIAKDTSQLNDPYILRGSAQLLCLIAGGYWLLLNRSGGVLTRYWPVFGYLAVVLASAVWSPLPGYVLFQAFSLAAVLIFFVAYFDRYRATDQRPTALLMNATIALYAAVAAISLALIAVAPAIAYGALDNGDAGIEYRFRGLFSKAGLMGSAAGLTLGMAWFGIRRFWLRIVVLVPAVLCLALTLSRTFWVAALVAGLMTSWRYTPHLRRLVAVAVLLVGVVWASLAAVGYQFDTAAAGRAVRVESVTTLTGRLGLWDEAFDAFEQSPVLGYGYTTGAAGLKSVQMFTRKLGNIDASRNIGRTTLHNGYLQSLLDVGLIGTFFYLTVMLLGIKRVYQLDRRRRYAAEFYGLIFLVIANVTQSVIYSASVFDSLLFWGLAIFALSLRPDSDVAAARVSYKPIALPVR